MHATEARDSHRFALLKFLMVFVFLLSPATVRAANTIIDSKTASPLPAVGTPGRLVNLTDGSRGLWLDNGIQWVSVNGRMFNVRIFGGTGDGSTGIRIFMGGSGMIEGTAVKGNIILASENGILLQGTNVSRALVADNQIVNNNGQGQGLRVEGKDCIAMGNISLDNRVNFADAGLRSVVSGNIFDTTSGQYDVMNKLSVGNGGAPISKYLSGSKTCPPPLTSNGAGTPTAVTLTGAEVGDTVPVGFSQAVPAHAVLVGAVTAPDTVTVTLMNFTEDALFNLAPGTLQVDVWQHTDYALNLNSGVGGQAPLPTTKIQSIKFI